MCPGCGLLALVCVGLFGGCSRFFGCLSGLCPGCGLVLLVMLFYQVFLYRVDAPFLCF